MTNVAISKLKVFRNTITGPSDLAFIYLENSDFVVVRDAVLAENVYPNGYGVLITASGLQGPGTCDHQLLSNQMVLRYNRDSFCPQQE